MTKSRTEYMSYGHLLKAPQRPRGGCAPSTLSFSIACSLDEKTATLMIDLSAGICMSSITTELFRSDGSPLVRLRVAPRARLQAQEQAGRFVFTGEEIGASPNTALREEGREDYAGR